MIGETLDSVLAQTYENWECIVVDDGSTDYTDELLEFYCEKDSRIQYHHRPSYKLKGANACRNFGYELSEGEFIQWFDDDDILIVDCFEKVIAEFSGIKKNDLVFYNYGIINSKGERTLEKMEFTSCWNNLYKDYALWNLKLNTGNVFFKRHVLRDQKIMFNSKIIRGQETEFFLRIFFGKQYTFKFLD